MAKLAFLGTPALSVITLEGLIEAGHEIELVVTQPDRRRGRRAEPSPSPVKQAALEHGLRVTDDLDALYDAPVELGVVVAFGRLIPASLLEAVPMVNLHFSLLPRWRGAAPVERAILAGDRLTGVCVMGVEVSLDTGPIYASRTLEVGEATLVELQSSLATAGTELLVELLEGGVASLPEPTPQVGEPTYAAKIDPSDLELDFSQPAEVLLRTVRLGRAFTRLGGSRLRVLAGRVGEPIAAPPGTLVGTRVATGQGSLELEIVQPEGRQSMDVAAWRRGVRDGAELRLG